MSIAWLNKDGLGPGDLGKEDFLILLGNVLVRDKGLIF